MGVVLYLPDMCAGNKRLLSEELDVTKSQALLLALCSFAFTLSGCAHENEVSYESGGMTHTLTEGDGAIPQNFPLPIYPNSKTTGSVQAQGEKEEQSKFLMLSSVDPVDTVTKFYSHELTESGWNVSTNRTLPLLVNIGAKKDDLEASVMISGDGKKTSISLGVCRDDKNFKAVADDPNFKPDALNPPTD